MTPFGADTDFGFSGGGGGGGCIVICGGLYTGASPSTCEVGGMPVGTNLTNCTFSQILQCILVPYISPSFSAFSLNDAGTYEIGTCFPAGSSFNFGWGFNGIGNVKANSMYIEDTTNSCAIGSALALTPSTHAYSTGYDICCESETTTSFKGCACNTQNVCFGSGSVGITWAYCWWFGHTPIVPTQSCEVRALPSTAFNHQQTSATFNTGCTDCKFTIALPPTVTLNQVYDLCSSCAVYGGCFNLNQFYVNDVAGCCHCYNVYTMCTGAPFACHNFLFVIN